MRKNLRRLVEERDRGVALILVIGIGALVTALLTTAIVIAVNGSRHARNDVNWQGALAAAYAGVEEYQSRLEADPGYVNYGNDQATFSAASNLLDDTTNAALGYDDSWAVVSGSDGNASYRYAVDAERYNSEGTIRLQSTGRVGDETRTIVVDLRQDEFLNYLYFTDYEIQDPAITNNTDECLRYAYQGRNSNTCGIIEFGNGDKILGEVHSNDTIYACQATFSGMVSTGWNKPSGARYSSTSSCSRTPVFEVSDPVRSNSPFYRARLQMPETNTAIRADAVASGCVYTGPTSITFTADGRMTVKSPWTRVTRPGATVSTPAECGSPAAVRAGTTIDVPNGAAIYVQEVPGPGYPNSWTTGKPSCGRGNPVGYPLSNETIPAKIDGLGAYGCESGDIFVKGVLDGQVTLAAQNYLYVVGSTTYEDRDDDMLGLIGNNMVWVWNPIINGSTEPRNVTIDAAILSLRSFTVQNVKVDSRLSSTPTLTVRGSIAQRFRGIVYSSWGNWWNPGATGYTKNYQYDSRLRFRSPPHFLSPVATAYGVSTWIETSSAYLADGREP